MKQFDNWKDFYHFMQWYEGELTIRKNKIYHNGILMAEKI